MKAKLYKGEKTAIIVGVPGLLATHCLRIAIDSSFYSKIIVISNQQIPTFSSKMEVIEVDFNAIDTIKDQIIGDDLYIALSTTYQKYRQKSFVEKVDYELPMEIAKLAKLGGVQQVLVASSLIANDQSRIHFSKIKGNLESDIKRLNFWSAHIFKPSFVVGKNTFANWGSRIVKFIEKELRPFAGSSLYKYNSIRAEELAQLMISAGQTMEGGTFEYPAHKLLAMIEDDQHLQKYLN